MPTENLLGGVEGKGLIHAQSVFGFTRLMVAAFGLGGGVAAMLKAIRYSRERVQAGTTLSEKQGYMDKLIVPHVVKLEAARAYIEEVARRLDAGEPELQTEGAIAKLFATEEGNAAADAAVQALGGYGYTKEYEVEKIRRDVRITTIYEGTSEIMQWTVSRDRWRIHLQERGGFYRRMAESLESLHREDARVGADVAALAVRARARNHRALPRRASHAPPARALPTGRAHDPRRNRGQLRPLRGRSWRREVRAVLCAQGGQGHVAHLRARGRARRAGRGGSPGAWHGRRRRRGHGGLRARAASAGHPRRGQGAHGRPGHRGQGHRRAGRGTTAVTVAGAIPGSLSRAASCSLAIAPRDRIWRK